ncbi:MAG: phosphoribosylformylglycinamidine synthase II [Polyangiales bacterium]|jgi:phosphoribosylformylglycinamidine synthase II
MNTGEPKPVQNVHAMPDDPEVNQALAAEFGLAPSEYEDALKTIARTPTYAELGVISVMWSEHCSYKSSRVHLARLPTEGPLVVQGPGENAGAVDIGDGFCAVFKMESHNHPSFISPHQGAATGVGGILRDVFTMGARPIANLNSLRFGRPDHPRTAELLRGVVAGIGDYGNCIGVPTVGGEVQFDESYDGNILVNAFALGIAESDSLFYGRAEGIGNDVIYVGARTGRDGIHGATMASATFEDDAEKKLPTVQVGDPFMEKLLLECCLEIFATGCLAGVQDMGAAGLTSSSVEMASRAGTGLELDLDAIPRRTEMLTPYEMLLSESQERMIMVAKPGRAQEVFDLCEKWDIEVAIVGKVTDTKRFICKATPGYDPLDENSPAPAPITVVDLPIDLLTDAAPKYDRPQRAPTPEPISESDAALTSQSGTDLASELIRLIGHPNIGSRAWIWRQYDHVVRDGTLVRPGEGDAAVIRAFCERDGKTIEKYLALSADCNGRYVQLDPFHGAAMAVAECARNIRCVGGRPLALTDCLNFGNPEVPENMWRFAQAIDGIAAACNALGVPVVSGNVSLYNETGDKAILPTPTVAIVGQLDSLDHLTTMAFDTEGDVILHLGKASGGNLAGSEHRTSTLGRVSGELPRLDLEAERALQECLGELSRTGLLRSAHDVSDGGLAVTLAESCIAGGVGAITTLPPSLDASSVARAFAEEPSRVVVSVMPQHAAEIERIARDRHVPCERLGVVGGNALQIEGASVDIATLKEAHRNALTSIVGDPGAA